MPAPLLRHDRLRHCGAVFPHFPASVTLMSLVQKLATLSDVVLDARRPRSDGKSYSQQITFVVDRPGHDLRYAIDPSHAESILGWKATEAFATGLAKTIDWYLANSDCLIPVKELGQLGTRTVAPANAPSQRLGEI